MAVVRGGGQCVLGERPSTVIRGLAQGVSNLRIAQRAQLYRAGTAEERGAGVIEQCGDLVGKAGDGHGHREAITDKILDGVGQAVEIGRPCGMDLVDGDEQSAVPVIKRGDQGVEEGAQGFPDGKCALGLGRD